jgi:3-oxoadipate CoA-transferase, alpha subunit
VVQVHEVVPTGGLHPEAVVTPGIFVDRVVTVPDERLVPPQEGQ